MENSFIEYFNNHLNLNEEETSFLKNNVPIVEVNKNEDLLVGGAVSSAFYFIVEGIIRMYYLVDGREKTTFFYQPSDFVSSYESFTKQVPSKHYLQAVEDSRVAVFNANVVAEIIRRYPRFEMLSRKIMEDELIIYQNILASFVTMDAEQRYCELIATMPHLFQKIPQYHIATYLGVSPETLSRIKSRVKAKGNLDDRQ